MPSYSPEGESIDPNLDLATTLISLRIESKRWVLWRQETLEWITDKKFRYHVFVQVDCAAAETAYGDSLPSWRDRLWLPLELFSPAHDVRPGSVGDADGRQAVVLPPHFCQYLWRIHLLWSVGVLLGGRVPSLMKRYVLAEKILDFRALYKNPLYVSGATIQEHQEFRNAVGRLVRGADNEDPLVSEPFKAVILSAHDASFQPLVIGIEPNHRRCLGTFTYETEYEPEAGPARFRQASAPDSPSILLRLTERNSIVPTVPSIVHTVPWNENSQRRDIRLVIPSGLRYGSYSIQRMNLAGRWGEVAPESDPVTRIGTVLLYNFDESRDAHEEHWRMQEVRAKVIPSPSGITRLAVFPSFGALLILTAGLISVVNSPNFDFTGSQPAAVAIVLLVTGLIQHIDRNPHPLTRAAEQRTRFLLGTVFILCLLAAGAVAVGLRGTTSLTVWSAIVFMALVSFVLLVIRFWRTSTAWRKQ